MRFKRITAVILSMIIALGLFVPAFAAVTYSFDEATGTLTITGSGAVTEADVSAAVNNDRTLIKKVAFGSGITSIGNYAFNGCTGLTEISLPSGLDSIGIYAFKGCSGLAEISLPSSLVSIGNGAFYDCVSLESINIPSGVTSIADDTFSGCKKLESVIMPGVERIGDRAFYGCKSIVSLDLPSGLESIGSYAFYNCPSLKNIVIPPTISHNENDSGEDKYAIGDNAFASCSNLKYLFLPYLTSVDFSNEQRRFCPQTTVMLGYITTGTGCDIVAAAGNTAAKSINIPERILSWYVRYVSAGVFSSYSNMTTAFIPDLPSDDAFNPSTTLFINGGESVRGNLDTAVITIPLDITSIADGAFDALENLRSIKVEEGNPAFISDDGVLYAKGPDGNPKSLICYPQQKANLYEYTIPDGVTEIKPFAFYGCNFLRKLTIPAGVESVGVSAFEKCTGLKEIIVDENNAHFISINGVLFTKDSEGRPEELVYYPLNKAEESYIIPDGVRSIGASAFYACKLKEITIPDSVTSIGESAFEGSEVSGTVIPDSVTSIGASAFKDSKLKQITIPGSVTSIGASAFKNSEVKQITIPDSVTSIGESAFEGILNVLYSADMTASGSPWGAEYANKYYEAPFVYESNEKQTVIYCEPDIVRAAVPVSVSSINHGVFENCASLTDVFLPAGFTNNNSGTGTGTSEPGTGTGTGTVSPFDPGAGTVTPVDPGTEPTDPVGMVTVSGIRFPESVNVWKYSVTAGAGASSDGLTHVSLSARHPGSRDYILCDAMGEGYRIDSADITGVDLFHGPDCPENIAFEIDSYEKLKRFASLINDGNIHLNAVLTADIDASSSAQANDWVPVGSPDYPYSAVFDGDGHKITGLTFNDPGSYYAGLFGYVGNSGIIRNVGLEDGSITGKDYVGGIAGYNCGDVTECYNAGIVTGINYVGGIAGYNKKYISRCSNAGSITGNMYVGGIEGGAMSGFIMDCCNSGSINGSYCVGGLLGIGSNSIISASYNSGSVYGEMHVGGVCGEAEPETAARCCYNIGEVSGTFHTGGIFGKSDLFAEADNCLSAGAVIIVPKDEVTIDFIKANTTTSVTYNTKDYDLTDYTGGISGTGGTKLYYCYYDINKAPGLSAVGSDKNIPADRAEGLTTEQMTGAKASENIIQYRVTDPCHTYSDIWLFKANGDGFAYYPHLKGFNFDEEGKQLPADEIAAEDWPAKTALANYEAGAHSLTLDGDIGVNFYMDIPDLTQGAYAVFTVDGVTSEVPADPGSYIMSGDTKLYKFTCNVAAAQTDTVITGYINNGGLPSVEFTYSVQEYLTELMNDPQYNDDEKMMTLAASLAAYGLYANELFGYNPDFTRHALADDSGFESVTAASLSDFAAQISDTADGVTYIGSSLLLRTKTGIRHYFSLPEGKTVDDFAFKLGDEILTPKTGKNGMYVEISDIPSAELGNPLTVTVFDGDNNVVNSWTYSAMTYVYNVLTKAEAGDTSISEELINAVKGLALYYRAADTYFSSLNAEP